jgi:hypothetical protein
MDGQWRGISGGGDHWVHIGLKTVVLVLVLGPALVLTQPSCIGTYGACHLRSVAMGKSGLPSNYY